MKKLNSLSLSKQNKLTELKQDKLRRLRNTKYQGDPIAWYKDKFKGDPKDIDWELFDFYKDHQWDGTPNPFKLMFENLASWKSVAIESATSTGKCLAPGTLIRMHDGSLAPVENIKKGDKVMGIDSKCRTATNIHSGIDDMYKIHQEGGMDYVCNSEHLISLKRRKRTSRRAKYLGEYADISVKELLKKPAPFFKDFAGYRVSVEYKKEPNNKIDPYYLGIWLGDGSAHNTGVTTPDSEIAKYLSDYARGMGLKIKDVSSSNRCSTYLLSNKRGCKNELLEMLREINVIKNKHIPKSYLITNKEDRLRLLAGLMDSDGYKDSYSYEMVAKRESLANDIVELANSLGFRTSNRKVKKGIKSTGFVGEYYRIHISGNLSVVPVRIKRKKIKKYEAKTLGAKNKRLNVGTCTINKIEHVGKGEYFGFSLDGDRKFLLKDGTVAHNTFLLPRAIYWFLDTFPNALVVTTAPKQSQLKTILWSEVKACFKKFKRIRPNAEMFSLSVIPNGVARTFGSKFSKEINVEDLNDDELSKHMAIGVVAGVGAGEESATKMQGFHAEHMLIVIEECAGVPKAVLTAIKQTSTGEKNIILAVGNPDSQTDSLHEFSQLDHVQHIRISAYDHPNIVNGKTLIHGAVSQQSIDIRRKELGEESNLYKSRVRGIAPKQASDSLIHYDWIMECLKGSDSYVDVPVDPRSVNALGVDVANSINGDMACCVWGKKNTLWRIHEFACPNANHLAHNLVKDPLEIEQQGLNNYHTGNIIDNRVAGHNIGVDAVGVGVGCVNEFVDTLGYEIDALQGGSDKDCIPLDDEGKPLYNFRSLRSQMYWQARQDLQKNEICIDISDKRIISALVKELTIVTFEPKEGYVAIESKEDIKKKLGGKSPNVGDGFVYWNWKRKPRKIMFDDYLPLGVPE